MAQPRANAALDQIKTTATTANETIALVKSKIEPGYEKYAGVADSTRGAMKRLMGMSPPSAKNMSSSSVP